MWLRWEGYRPPGNDHGLAIDDFSVTANGIPTGDTAPTVTSTTPADSASQCRRQLEHRHQLQRERQCDARRVNDSVPDGFPANICAERFARQLPFTLNPACDLPYSTFCTVTVTADQITDADTNDPPDQMASDFTFSFTTADPPPPVATNVIINELDADTPGTDAAEFVELYDGGVGNTCTRRTGRRLLQRQQRHVVRGVRSRRIQHRCEWLLHRWKPWSTWRRFDLRPGSAACCKTERMPLRSMSATRPTFPTARPSPRRTCRMPSSTTPTMRTIRACWPC